MNNVDGEALALDTDTEFRSPARRC